jgi:hypothetical protein
MKNKKQLVFECLNDYLNEKDGTSTKKPSEDPKGSPNKDDAKLEDFINKLGEEIAKEVVVKTTELKKKKDSENKTNESYNPSTALNESLLLTGISVALASPKIISLLAKLVKFISKKFGSKSGEKFASNMVHFAHKMHKWIHKPVEWIGKKLGLKSWSLETYEKGEKQGLTAERFSEIVVGLTITSLLVVSGIGLVKALTHLESAHIVSEGALVTIKSKEISEIINKIASSAARL